MSHEWFKRQCQCDVSPPRRMWRTCRPSRTKAASFRAAPSPARASSHGSDPGRHARRRRRRELGRAAAPRGQRRVRLERFRSRRAVVPEVSRSGAPSFAFRAVRAREPRESAAQARARRGGPSGRGGVRAGVSVRIAVRGEGSVPKGRGARGDGRPGLSAGRLPRRGCGGARRPRRARRVATDQRGDQLATRRRHAQRGVVLDAGAVESPPRARCDDERAGRARRGSGTTPRRRRRRGDVSARETSAS